MYANTDNSTYATVTNSQSGTTSYYIYIRGFNFEDIPANAVVSSFTVKFKARESGVSTSSSYRPYLANGTTTLTGTASTIGTTASTITFTGVSADWETIVGYGSNFGIRINCRRASRNTTGYVYIYGAEILVEYTIPVYHSVTLNNTTSANVVVSDSNPLEGTDVTVSANTLSGITVKDNGADVTSQFVQGMSETISVAADTQVNSGIQSGEQYAEYAVEHTAEDPYQSTSNMYASSGSIGYVYYTFNFSAAGLDPDATILSVQVKVYGHRESSTVDSTHVAQVQLVYGIEDVTGFEEERGTAQNFTSTSNQLITIEDPGTWTAADLYDGYAVLRFAVGYYGGLVCGITWSVTYEVDGYVYTISNITTDHTIVVSASGEPGYTLYAKVNGTWKQTTKVLVKQNGTWIQSTKIRAKNNGSWS